jgi:glycerol uptake facilitator-like aquaporin
MTAFEGVSNVVASFFIEIVFTSILLIVIFANTKPGNAYRKALAIGNTGYTFGFVITGLTLVTLLYTANIIAVKTGIGAGHMFPLVTIPAMMSKGLGFLSVSVPKGMIMLLGQLVAMVIAYVVIY